MLSLLVWTACEKMGLSGAHDALQDVKDTTNIFIKLQKSRRAVYRNMKFEKALPMENI